MKAQIITKEYLDKNVCVQNINNGNTTTLRITFTDKNIGKYVARLTGLESDGTKDFIIVATNEGTLNADIVNYTGNKSISYSAVEGNNIVLDIPVNKYSVYNVVSTSSFELWAHN